MKKLLFLPVIVANMISQAQINNLSDYKYKLIIAKPDTITKLTGYEFQSFSDKSVVVAQTI